MRRDDRATRGTDHARASASAVLRVAACVLCGLASACGPPPASRAPVGVVLRPGDTLLESAEDVRVEAWPATNLPPGAAEQLGRVLSASGFHVLASEWVAGPVLPPDSPYRMVVGVSGAVGRWKARVDVALDLDIGRLWITHDGRPVEALRELPGASGDDARKRMWHDPVSHTLFWWDAASRALVAFAEQPPGEIAYGVTADEGAGLSRFERALAGRPAPVDGRDVLFRTSLASVEAPVLAAPAPTVLAFDVAELRGDRLRLTTSVLDLGFTLGDERVERVSGAGDGVVFAVEVESDGVRTRAWSRRLDPGEVWVDQTVDLSRWTGRACTLRLLTEPGFDGDADFDYALWGGLRLEGDGAAPSRPHIVLVDIDTLRADRLSCDGAERETTPRLDAWAARHAVVFRDDVSGNDWTLPATTTLLTGLTVSQHGVTESPRVLTAGMRPLAARLHDAGYETVAYTDGGFLAPTFGMSIGFDVFDHRLESDAEHVARGFREAVERLRGRRSERPVFLFLHSYQVHAPYELDLRFDDPEHPYDGPLAGVDVTPLRIDDAVAARGGALRPEDVEYVRALYDASVRRMDDELGDVLDALPELFGDQPYAVVVTSDHGEELFERGTTGHGLGLHREQLAVPLIVEAPGLAPGVDDSPVASIDLVPTLLDVAGLPPDRLLSGRSLLAPAPPAASIVRYAQHRESARALLHDGMKRILGEVGVGTAAHAVDALYLRAGDPWEHHDVARERPDLVAELDSLLTRFLAEHPQLELQHDADSADHAADDDLRALGYLRDH